MRIALAQIDIALGEPERNLQTAQQMAAQAAEAGADLLLLPELWGSGYDLERAPELADELNAGLFGATATLARHHQIAICGSLLEWDATTELPASPKVEGATPLPDRPGRVYNTATLYDAAGSLLGRYRKTHLIGLMNEDRFLAPGDEARVWELPWATTGLAICYDLRFPELFRRYALDGAALILMPSEWPVQRIEHWRVLLRARAIENQCFVAAVNRVGADRANTFGGCSAVIGPRGEVVAEAGDAEELLLADLDLEAVAQARGFMPIFADRRPEVYRLSDE